MNSRLAALLVPFLVLAACSNHAEGPDMGRLYNRNAQSRDDLRNPVILIPGLMGTRLIDSADGTIVWGSFTHDYADPETAAGARQFGLPMAEQVALASLRDSVIVAGSLDQLRIKVLGLPIAFDAYNDILSALGVGGYRSQDLAERGEVDYGSDHFTCFQFDYDWRRDNAENARLLHEFILEKRAYVQGELERRYGIEDRDVRFDIVAHSMGALVTRYYLRYGNQALPDSGAVPDPTWAGAQYVDRAVLVAPPNAGSPQTVVELVKGKDFGLFLPRYSPALLGTLPSLYELLPRDRHKSIIDEQGNGVPSIYDPRYWQEMQWGLADPDEDEMLAILLPRVEDPEERRRIALDHLGKCLRNAERFAAALDIPATPPANLQIDLIAGDSVDTPSLVQLKGHSPKVVETAPGDGKVLRSSALMDERIGGEWQPTLVSPISWRQVTFLFAHHLELTKSPAFIDNMLYMLMEAPR